MNLGRLSNVLRIELATETRHPVTNEIQRTWSELRTVLCEAELRPGREFFEAGQRYAETLYRFRCHFHDVFDVTETMRLVFEKETLNIKSVRPNYQERDEALIDASTALGAEV